MSISEASSKIHEPTSYEEAISDPIHGRQWKDAVEEELYNLESHHTWENYLKVASQLDPSRYSKSNTTRMDLLLDSRLD